jgi:hypothetical protein
MVVEREQRRHTSYVDCPGAAGDSAQNDLFRLVTVAAEMNDMRLVLQQKFLQIDWLNCRVLEQLELVAEWTLLKSFGDFSFFYVNEYSAGG